jgi:arabinofuranosyltransferase
MDTKTRKILTLFLLFVFSIVLIRTAWVGDDSYITMRTVDNFLNGYGPTWNIDERVQTYTHPLWMFLLTIVYGVSRDAYLSLIGLSIFISLLTIFIFLAYRPGDDYSVLIGSAVLVLSNAYIDYSTSGLENPASHLLVLLFTLGYLKWKDQPSQKRILILMLLASLLTLNRMDLFLLCLPALLDIVLKMETRKRLLLLLTGFTPFILWELFSIIYYGFPFPNTYYAKLNTGIAHSTLIKHGGLYLFNSIASDPITLTAIGASLILSMVWGNKQEKLISLGVGLYLGYVVWIGGDFMSGRFLSAPLLSSVIVSGTFLNKVSFFQKTVVFVIVIVLGLMAYHPSFSVPTTHDDKLEKLTGVGDEQAGYYPTTALWRWRPSISLPDHQWIFDGIALREQGVKVYIGKGIGFLGFSAGPGVHVIDIFALSDPLLSHLPVRSRTDVLIGHFRRSIPVGYEKTLETGVNQMEDLGIAKYYEKLSLITRGRIWSLERWEAIWKLNSGQYDYLLVQ